MVGRNCLVLSAGHHGQIIHLHVVVWYNVFCYQ